VLLASLKQRFAAGTSLDSAEHFPGNGALAWTYLDKASGQSTSGGRILRLMIAAIHGRKTAAEQPSVIRQALAISALALLIACSGLEELPGAPSDLTTGIVIYQHADYLGVSAHLTQDIRHLRTVEGPCERPDYDDYSTTVVKLWDDCISSVRVSPGWRAVLYRDGDFDGDQLQLTEDTPNLTLSPGDCDKGGFNDCTTSIRIFRP
jgi:hypothetical protein